MAIYKCVFCDRLFTKFAWICCVLFRNQLFYFVKKSNRFLNSIFFHSKTFVSNRASFIADFTENQSLYWIYYTLLSSLSVWLCIVGCLVAAIIPDVLLKAIDNLKYAEKIKKLEANTQLNT